MNIALKETKKNNIEIKKSLADNTKNTTSMQKNALTSDTLAEELKEQRLLAEKKTT